MRASDLASYLTPPIVPMLIRKLRRRHPFDCLPPGARMNWLLDVGANKGDVTVAALRTYPNAKVICFEPVEATFNILKSRVAAYPGRTILFKKALADDTGTGAINITSFHGANSILPQAPSHKHFNPHVAEIRKEEISLVRLDEICAEFPTPHVDVMKIDVEGFEINVLKGGVRFIASSVDTIIVEASLMRDVGWEKQGFMEVFSMLTKLGFRLVNVFDIHKAANSEMMLLQMDCVWRHQRVLTAHSAPK